MERMVILHLKLRTQQGAGDRLIDFLRSAVEYYERPGGIRVRLLRSVQDPDLFVEIAEYQDRGHYDRDQQRVEFDPAMRSLLESWRSLLAEPVIVETYEDLTSEIR
jgi:quinol monooxygenase YgiN